MLLISDTNIIIDMVAGELLETMFELELEFAVPDVLFDQELSDHYPELPDLGLQLLTVEPDGVSEVLHLSAKLTGNKAPGFNDLMALMLAKQEGCPLLTGDRRLRELSREQYPDIEVRGTIWLVEQLLVGNLINAEEANVAYEKMRQDGSRLPEKDIRNQLKEHGFTP